MVRLTILAALAVALLPGGMAEAKSRGSRGSGGSHHDHSSSSSGWRGGSGSESRDGSDSPAKATPTSGPAHFQSCPPHAPCTTANGLKYVTDPTTGVSRFLPK
jgi:hypothetical protein